MSENEDGSWASKLSAGPYRLGDPDDLSLRRVEREVLIPQIIRERSKTEKCLKSKQEFDQCCLENGPLMVLHCRKQNTAFMQCMSEWFHNREFYEECKQIYLDKRSEFRRTGVKEPAQPRGSKTKPNYYTDKKTQNS